MSNYDCCVHCTVILVNFTATFVKGPSVAFEWAGRECVTRCRATAAELGLLHEGKGDSHFYISSSPAEALSVSKLVFELFQMKMGA